MKQTIKSQGAECGKICTQKARQEASDETLPKRRMSPGRAIDYHKCFSSLFDDTDYLKKKYGIATEAFQLPSLQPREQTIATTLARLLELVDEHLSYWSTKNAPATLNSLHKAKTFLVGLLGALLYGSLFLDASNLDSAEKENRWELLSISMYETDGKSLLSAFRAPRAKDGDERSVQVREQIHNIRQEFAAKFSEVLRDLQELTNESK
jgi:hypothetical protein